MSVPVVIQYDATLQKVMQHQMNCATDQEDEKLVIGLDKGNQPVLNLARVFECHKGIIPRVGKKRNAETAQMDSQMSDVNGGDSNSMIRPPPTMSTRGLSELHHSIKRCALNILVVNTQDLAEMVKGWVDDEAEGSPFTAYMQAVSKRLGATRTSLASPLCPRGAVSPNATPAEMPEGGPIHIVVVGGKFNAKLQRVVTDAMNVVDAAAQLTSVHGLVDAGRIAAQAGNYVRKGKLSTVRTFLTMNASRKGEEDAGQLYCAVLTEINGIANKDYINAIRGRFPTLGGLIAAIASNTTCTIDVLANLRRGVSGNRLGEHKARTIVEALSKDSTLQTLLYTAHRDEASGLNDTTRSRFESQLASRSQSLL